MKKKVRDLRGWIEARQRHHLSHAHVQMARELGMNPRKLGSIDNHRQEPWKIPLPAFIEELYERRFKKARPDRVVPIEERAADDDAQRAARRAARRKARTGSPPLNPHARQIKAIGAVIARFISAYNAGDVDEILVCYAEDLVKIRQGGAIETKPETAERLRALFESFTGSLWVENDEIVVSGDVAFTRGSFGITLTPRAGGESQYLERRYVELWRRERGRWRVARTMDNTSDGLSTVRPQLSLDVEGDAQV